MEEGIERCAICNKTSSNAEILDAVLDKDILKLCETCAIVEGAVSIPEPSKEQLQEADRPYTVYERLVRVSGVNPKSEKNSANPENKEEVTLSSLQDKWFKGKEQETQEKMQTVDVPEIQEIKKSADGEEFSLDFRSKNLRIADLHKIRNKFFTEEHAALQKDQEKETAGIGERE